MLRIFIVDEEFLSDEEGSPLEVAKFFSELREKYCDKSLSNEVNISLNFSLILIEEVSIISFRKEEVVRSSAKIVPSV